MFWFGGSVVPEAPDPRINQFSTGYGSIQSNAVFGRAEYRFNDNVSASRAWAGATAISPG